MASDTGGGPQSARGLGALLNDRIWNDLLRNGTVVRFAPRATLLRQGDPATHVLLLIRGAVKVIQVGTDGDRYVIAVRGAGEVLGEIAVFGGGTRSATLIAVEPCLTYVLPAERFRRIITDHRAIGEVLRHLTIRYRESEAIRAELADLAVQQRLARILLRFALANNNVPLTQQELADAAGLSRSAVAAQLATFRDHGWVRCRRGRVDLLDVRALRGAASR